MSSFKMTFSLASLILFIALGLVLVPTSVLAHDNATRTSPTTPRWHEHPLNETYAAQTDSNATPNDLGTQVNPHTVHPDPSISLKAQEGRVKGTEIQIVPAADTADDATKLAALQFTVIVDFTSAVNAGDGVDGTETEITAGSVLESSDLFVRILNAENASLFNTKASNSPSSFTNEATAPPEAAEVLYKVSRVTGSNSKFEVRFAIGSNFHPNGTTNDAKEKLTFRIQIPRYETGTTYVAHAIQTAGSGP